MQAKGSTCEIRTKKKPTPLHYVTLRYTTSAHFQAHLCNSQWAFNYIPYTYIKAIIKALRQARAALQR